MATVILIPKPGRSPGLENLRPISLTSCIGKVMEHAVHNRISRYIERKGLFPYNVVGFRPALSSQDVMLLLKTQIFDSQNKDIKGILALDLTKAFDKITHECILKEISAWNLGNRFFFFCTIFPGKQNGDHQDRTFDFRSICAREQRYSTRGGHFPSSL